MKSNSRIQPESSRASPRLYTDACWGRERERGCVCALHRYFHIGAHIHYSLDEREAPSCARPPPPQDNIYPRVVRDFFFFFLWGGGGGGGLFSPAYFSAFCDIKRKPPGAWHNFVNAPRASAQLSRPSRTHGIRRASHDSRSYSVVSVQLFLFILSSSFLCYIFFFYLRAPLC